MSNPTPGILFLSLEPKPSAYSSDFDTWRSTAFSSLPGITESRILAATDAMESHKPYRYQNMYFVSDTSAITFELITSLLSSTFASAHLAASDWALYSLISLNTRETLTGGPQPGTVVVCVGMTPLGDPEILKDYHAWYVEEHVDLLSVVPGWRTGARGKLVSTGGAGKEYAAPFVAVHQYDEENGLGGPEWKVSVTTPWTKRVHHNLGKPNHRRVWKYVV